MCVFLQQVTRIFCKNILILFQNDLDKNITLLKDKEEELDKAIERISNEEPIDVDEAVTTTAPLYKQWVKLNWIVVEFAILKMQ